MSANDYTSNDCRNDCMPARGDHDTALAGSQEVLSWATDDTIDKRVTDTVHRWLMGMEEAIARAASRARK